MAYYSKSSPYASTAKQWGYFKALTGHSLPSGCSKSEASSLIDKAKKGEWKPALRIIEVGRFQFHHGFQGPDSTIHWAVWVDHRTVGGMFGTQEEAERYARAQARNDETVTTDVSKLYTQLVD